MKAFLIKSLFFLLPLMLIFAGVEWYIRNSSNSFISKANYFKNNSNSIEVLVLGTSHNQNGVNPKYFTSKTCNLAYASQNIQLDSAVFFSAVKKLKNLKKVVFEMDYHRMEIDSDDKMYRLPWYYIYYGIEVYPLKAINKYSLYASNTAFFNNVIIDDIKNSGKAKEINEFGFVEKNYSNEFEKLQYDSIKINARATQRLKNRHRELSVEAFRKNQKRIEAIIDYCKKNNIELYFFSSPLYHTYLDSKIPEKEKRFKAYIKELISKYNIHYYNFENSKKFTISDFSNEDHLNAIGAEKYSKTIDSILQR